MDHRNNHHFNATARVVRLQQREEKHLEASLESLITQVAHVKNALHSFIFKLENEYERLTW